ncbi:MAG: COQ9 family protein [Phenylobacterium sp.]|nr:COQ9 family protein [Phenylobacterium sp.]MCA6227880.1 COQ9 family protein [Phenylobacterium sp.]MCA6230739.1 COQ9 family protein [Phenylobacterium sp.]MCA6236127.1 COQ9 family protein [Phenylobacterium sp.]MCA6250567.1 COQ9 family protein [Phenylobacterium sp.]
MDMQEDPEAWLRRAEQAVLDAALVRAPGMGWTPAMAAAAGADAGFSPGETELILPYGPADLAALLSRRHDAAALAALPDPAGLKIRQRIRAAVLARLDAAAADAPAVRRCSGWLALPPNAAQGLSLAWESADRLWRWAGDVAADENHYSKRAILAGILIAALAVRLREGEAAAESFVDARIANVMAFEAWKARQRPGEPLRRAAEALGRLRYGAPVNPRG